MPRRGRALVALHQRHRDAMERLEALAGELGDGRGDLGRMPQARPMPFEEVRTSSSRTRTTSRRSMKRPRPSPRNGTCAKATLGDRLARQLLDAHGVRVVPAEDWRGRRERRYDPGSRVLRLSPYLEPGQHAFQLATQLAFFEVGDMLDELVAAAPLSSDTACSLARIGLANYFAAALLLPYGEFPETAEQLRHDIDQLARRFGGASRPSATA